jgi:diadenosine tetraphosphate (Ap4A) HIT family hydrolase
MTLPYAEPLTPRAPAPRVVPEPLRPGDPGGPPCHLCGDVEDADTVWSDADWVLNPGRGTSIPGTVWLMSRHHADSFADLPPELAAGLGPVAGRIERAILSLGDIARVHLYRWGDGCAHFHVWFLPRPLGMLEATKMMLPLWEDVLPAAPDEEVQAALKKLRAALA